MLVNVTDVFASEGKVISKEIPFERTVIVHEGSGFPVKDSSAVSLKLSNTAQGKALVEARLKLSVAVPCDRCLNEVEYPLDLNISREVCAPDRAGADELEEQDAFMEGYSLNIDSLIDNEITTSWPMKVLCRPRCV